MASILHGNSVFTQESSPVEAFKIYDADWNEKNGLVVALEIKRKRMIYWDGEFIPIPVNTKYPIVRWIDRERILLVNARNEIGSHNCFILDKGGEIRQSFDAGDAIEDVSIGTEGIWISYFDEGVFGKGISTEGLVLFNFNGRPIFKFLSDLQKKPRIVDCYALVKGKGTSVWLFPYSDFPLIEVKYETKSIASHVVPEILHGASAIAVRGKFAYFHDRTDMNGELIGWEIGTNETFPIGYVEGVLRGLGPKAREHFISISRQTNEIFLYRIENEEEYS